MSHVDEKLVEIDESLIHEKLHLAMSMLAYLSKLPSDHDLQRHREQLETYKTALEVTQPNGRDNAFILNLGHEISQLHDLLSSFVDHNRAERLNTVSCFSIVDLIQEVVMTVGTRHSTLPNLQHRNCSFNTK